MKFLANIKKKKIYVLSSFGHSGIDWISSLLDNHPEILIIPSLSFFRNLEKIKLRNKNFKNYNEDTKINLFCNNLFKQNKKESLRLNLKIINKDDLIKNVKKNFNHIKEKNFEKKLFYAIHVYFVNFFKINYKKIKIIICHEHAPWNCKKYQKYFDAKLITIIRDPRAAIAGSFRGYERTKVLSLSHRLEMTFCFLFYSIKNYQKYFKNRVFLISNERFNKDLKGEMIKLSKWLKINYKRSLIKQTFLGKIWYGETSYKSKKDLKKKVEKNYYNRKNVEKRWLRYLSDDEIKFIETKFKEIFVIGRYKKKFNLNWIEKKIILTKFLLNKNLFNRQKIKIDNFFKYFIKKILLLIFKEKYNFFVKLT